MPTRENTCMFAMYVIGEVESGWDWTGVNRNDPITIGMMQNYGQRAANCIIKCRDADPDGWTAFQAAAPSLAAAVDAGHDWNWWTGYWVNDAEANAWQEWAQRDGNHVGQQELWIEDANGYIDLLVGWGLSEDRPQTLVFAMSMYHQSPLQCQRVLQSCGGSATLDLMHSTCLADGVLGQYTNRYNTVYERLAAWDGESAPPDFGQVGSVGAGSGGQAPNISGSEQPITRVQLDNGIITLYGSGAYENGLVCYRSAPNVWLPCVSVATQNPSGGNTGGGSATGSAAAEEMKQWLLDHEHAFAYSQGAGRMSPEDSGYTDCSALMWYVYHIITGQEIGTWTGDQQNYGTVIADGSGALPQDQMQVMDLVFFNWSYDNPMYDHVEAYIGNNQLTGHGGPGSGPYVKENADAYASSAYNWRVRRYL